MNKRFKKVPRQPAVVVNKFPKALPWEKHMNDIHHFKSSDHRIYIHAKKCIWKLEINETCSKCELKQQCDEKLKSYCKEMSSKINAKIFWRKICTI